jgi:hypothetical protein
MMKYEKILRLVVIAAVIAGFLAGHGDGGGHANW